LGKTIAGMAKVKVRGIRSVRHAFTFAMAAYNLIRMPRLLAVAWAGSDDQLATAHLHQSS